MEEDSPRCSPWGRKPAWMGTRFVVADESGTHPEYRNRIVGAKETDAVWSRDVFDGGWPDAPVRTLENATLRDCRDAGSPVPGSRPGEGDVIGTGPTGRRSRGTTRTFPDWPRPEISKRWQLRRPKRGSGQKRGFAADIVREVAADAERNSERPRAERPAIVVIVEEAEVQALRLCRYRGAYGAEPRTVVLVEGESDQRAVEALAERRGRDLAAEGVSVVPIGGSKNFGRFRATTARTDSTSDWQGSVTPRRNGMCAVGSSGPASAPT